MRHFIYISPEGETRKRVLTTLCKEHSTYTYITDSANYLMDSFRIYEKKKRGRGIFRVLKKKISKKCSCQQLFFSRIFPLFMCHTTRDDDDAFLQNADPHA